MLHTMLLQISGGWVQAAQLLLALTILVIIHEAGHFFAAKLFKMRVNKFYVFFDFLFPFSNLLNFSLFKIKRGNTEYGIGWFPLGGYVSIAGMVDETSDGSDMDKPPEPDEYRAKPRWQRFVVLIGGIVMNLILGWLLYLTMLMYYEKDFLPASEVKEIYPTQMGRSIGLQAGDIILSSNGNKHERFGDLFSANMYFGGTLQVMRDGKQTEIKVPGNFFKQAIRSKSPVFVPLNQSIYVYELIDSMGAKSAGITKGDRITGVASLADTHRITPARNFFELTDLLQQHKQEGKLWVAIERNGKRMQMPVAVDTAGKLGFFPSLHDSAYYTYKKYSIVSAAKYAATTSYKTIILQAISLGKMFSGDVSVREISGPIGMASMFSKTWDWQSFWSFCAMISIVLAFMNLLPIPVLDGGHIVILLIEGIIGRPLSVKTMNVIQTIGMIIVLVLMVFAFGNDILKKFGL